MMEAARDRVDDLIDAQRHPCEVCGAETGMFRRYCEKCQQSKRIAQEERRREKRRRTFGASVW